MEVGRCMSLLIQEKNPQDIRSMMHAAIRNYMDAEGKAALACITIDGRGDTRRASLSLASRDNGWPVLSLHAACLPAFRSWG